MTNYKKVIKFFLFFIIGFTSTIAVFSLNKNITNKFSENFKIKKSSDILSLRDFLQEKRNKTKKITMKIRNNDTLSLVLQRAGIGYTEIKNISKSIETVFNVDMLKPFKPQIKGDIINLEISQIPENERLHKDIIWTVKELLIIKSPLEKIITVKATDGFISKSEKGQAKIKYIYKTGMIKEEQSFIYSATKSGISYDVIDKFYDVLSFDVDFERDIYPEDSYKVFYEEKYTQDGEFIEVGPLLYAELNLHGKEIKLYRFKKDNGKTAFYDENGKGASKTLKKTPINGARISSNFGYRTHPILGFTKFHKGVDFAAPKGTPIPAAGDGIIERRGWNSGGYGNMILIRHNATYSTLYAHMSAFKLDVRKGSHVKQGDIIGFVGATGMATGPHLHYEIRKNGKSVNPIYVSLPSTNILSGDDLEKYNLEVSRIKELINLNKQ